MIICRKCGRQNASTETFCANCGAFLEWTGERADGPRAEPVEQTPLRLPAPGRELGEGALAAPKFDRVIADIEPDRLEAAPGEQVVSTIRVRNAGTVVDAISLRIVGDAAGWASIQPGVLNLYPGADGVAQIVIRVPRGPQAAAGVHRFDVAVSSQEHPASGTVVPGMLTVGAFDAVRAEIRPSRARGRRGARFLVTVTSDGNRSLAVRLAGTDPDGALDLDVRPPRMELAPGTAASATVAVRSVGSITFGPDQARPFRVAVHPDDAAVATPRPLAEVSGTFTQAAVLTRVRIALVAAAAGLVILGGLAVRDGCLPFTTGCPGVNPPGAGAIATPTPEATVEATEPAASAPAPTAEESAGPTLAPSDEPTTPPTESPTEPPAPTPTPTPPITPVPAGPAVAVRLAGGPFEDPRVQEAVVRLMDWATEVPARVGSTATATMFTGAGERRDLLAQGFDPEVGRQLLAEAGYPEGFSFTIVVEPSGNLPDLAQRLRDVVQAIGLSVPSLSVPQPPTTAGEIYNQLVGASSPAVLISIDQ